MPQPIHVAVCGAGAFGKNHIRVYRELEAAGHPVHLAAIIEPSAASALALVQAGWACEWPLAPSPHQLPVPLPDAISGLLPVALSNALRESSSGSSSESSPKSFPGSSSDSFPDSYPESSPKLSSIARDATVPATPTAVPIFRSLDDCLAQLTSGALHLDAASVCVPTSAHFEAASALIQAGVHVLIEKPIASTLEQADELIRLGRLHHRLIQVGHLERFNPAVTALAPLIHRPMFFEAHRLSLFSPRALDVDVVLDLMIHDLDIVLQLAQSRVREVHAVGLPILSSKVDIANVRVEFESGCVANFTASRVSTERVRKLRFFQPHQYVSVDYARQDLLLISVNKPAKSAAHGAAHATDPSAAIRAAALPYAAAIHFAQSPEHGIASASDIASPMPGLAFEKPHIVQREPLRLEIEAFLAAIQGDRPLAVPAEQGREALALALQVQAAMEVHSTRAGLSGLY